jgi:hypothetical protein
MESLESLMCGCPVVHTLNGLGGMSGLSEMQFAKGEHLYCGFMKTAE